MEYLLLSSEYAHSQKHFIEKIKVLLTDQGILGDTYWVFCDLELEAMLYLPAFNFDDMADIVHC